MPKRLKRWIGRGLAATVALVLVAWLTGYLLLRSWTNRPPPLPGDTAILQAQPVERDGRVWLGASSFYRREGLMVVHLKGAPLEMGYACGVLLREPMHTLESEFLEMVQGYVPNPAVLTVLKWYVIYQNRHLSQYVPEPCRLEIYGETLGCPDSHPELGDYYNRMLNYHAAHDVSYLMIDNPLVTRAGCTAFGVWGEAAAGGHLITGRSFDWEADDVFDRDRVVQLYEPDDGIPFVSVSWAGMVGVVSGMNRAGVSVTINGAPSQLPSQAATPVAIVAREVLQKAHNLDEALDILRTSNVFVSSLWLVGSRADVTFVVVEKTPTATEVRRADGEAIICANHFLTPELQSSAHNQAHMREATSVRRAERMQELLDDTAPIGPEEAVAMLRDRQLAGGVFAGNGHRASLNPFIATHATVMDLTAGVIWVATTPHQLGRFVAFDVNDFDRDTASLTLPEDPILTSGEYERADKAFQSLKDGRQALSRGEAEAALKLADQAEQWNPRFYQNAMLRGQALLSLGRTNEAATALQTALDGHPAFLIERHQVEGLLGAGANGRMGE